MIQIPDRRESLGTSLEQELALHLGIPLFETALNVAAVDNKSWLELTQDSHPVLGTYLHPMFLTEVFAPALLDSSYC